MKLQLALGLGLGAHRKVGGAGNKPATFSIAAGFANAGTKRINFSEPVKLTITGGVTLSIGSTQYQSGDTIPVAGSTYHALTINNPGGAAGTITFGNRKQITYLNLQNIGLSVITGDITGMNLTYLRIENMGLSVITGDITGMNLTYLLLNTLGSSVITGDITGMNLTRLYLNNIGSSLTYGTNLLNITSTDIQLLGSTVFTTAAEYERLIIDAASGTWIPVGSNAFRIDTGTTDTDPGWDSVKAHVAVLRTKAAWTIIPAEWLEDNGGSWPADWYEYTE
ncbi:MAG: hypothetical protein PHS01_10540 [Dysgonamonadaceae bacterium]|nr:hypothetical protein [Dysgonamonadaceae bacterium]